MQATQYWAGGKGVARVLKVSFEGKILLLLNLADALHTAFLIETGLAVEFNPFMGVFLRYGVSTFVAGKVAIVSVLVLLLELLKSKGKHLRMIKSLQWAAIIWFVFAAFLFPYLQLFLHLIPRMLT
ncbi:hypothetical protein ES703_49681 [subsurface metagenome]